ncbi:hypothetical protein ACROYT_G023603 [Oculina patagonica]
MKPTCSWRELAGKLRDLKMLMFRLRGLKMIFLTLLTMSLFVCYFVIFNHVEDGNNITAKKQRHHLSAAVPLSVVDNVFNVVDENASFLVVFPYSSKEENISQELKDIDKRSLWKLSHFLGSMKEFHGATCLQQPLAHNHRSGHDAGIKTARSISLDSSWCRFIAKKWSVHIKNTGPVQNLQVKTSAQNESSREEMIVLQSCNILQGPFVIRRDVFLEIGGLINGFGKLTLLDFFLRSKGELKMAKSTSCVWTREITRADRGTLQGSNEVPEYASFANKHKILRIVTENRIEWTTCVANWKLCPEKPFVKPQDLPSIAAPICCSAVLGKMLTDFKWALNKLGLEYRVVYGTLLGAVRSQAIIPWTYDIDIALPKAAFDRNSWTFTALQNLLGSQYYVGESHDMKRGHMLLAPYLEINTAPYFDGPDDLEGNALFSSGLEEAVKDMLPVSQSWRKHCYVDFYEAPAQWMKGYTLVTINNEQFLTVKNVEHELTNWYGKNYRKPELTGNWTG